MMADLKQWLVISWSLSVSGGPASTPVPDATTDVICPEVMGELYFVLNGVTYQHNSTVYITEIGYFDRASGYADADSSFTCKTEQVNTQCCRGQDGGNVGEWYFPNGSMVPRERHIHSNFSRSGYRMQVRLNRKNEAMGPLGTYTCKVPREDGCGGLTHIASVTIAVPTPSSVQSFCMLTTWSPPIGPYDMYSGYDVRYFNISGNEVIFEVANNKFHLVFADYKEVLGLGAPRDVLVQVRVRTDSDHGPWSLPVPVCDSTP